MEKNKPASVNYFAIVVLARNKTCETFLSFLCFGTSCIKNAFSTQWQKEPVSYLNEYSRILFGILAGLTARRPQSLLRVIASVVSSIVFFVYTSWRSSATVLLVELGLFSSLRRSKSVTTCSSIFCPLTGSAEMSPLDFTATVK